MAADDSRYYSMFIFVVNETADENKNTIHSFRIGINDTGAHHTHTHAIDRIVLIHEIITHIFVCVISLSLLSRNL